MANYIKIEYGNSCDLGRTYYSGGFLDRLFFEAVVVKPNYTHTEEGFENGNAVFVKTSETLKKQRRIEVVVPEYLVDALQAMALCDTVNISDTDGTFYYQARNIEINSSPEDISNACMYTVEILFEVDDQVVKSSCCVNM